MSSTSVVGRDPETGLGLEIEISNGFISAVKNTAHSQGSYLSAGLIDLQVNGFKAIDLNDGGLDADRVIAFTHMMHSLGTTTFLPTLITASAESLTSSLMAIADAKAKNSHVAHSIPFVHVEGPFVSPLDGPRGAHPKEHVREADLDEVLCWQKVSGNLVGKITLSPHFDQAPAFIRALVAQGILVSIGHTHASVEQIRAATDAGACFSTHLGNGSASMLPRHPNFIWAQLADDRLTASFITDGFHLSPETFKAMLRAKGLDRSVLVSDVTALGGMPPGIYDQAIGGKVSVSADGRLSVVDTPYLAGAAKTLSHNVASAIEMANLTLAQGLKLATLNPGFFVGERGCIAVGQAADLILFDWQEGDPELKINKVLVKGESI